MILFIYNIGLLLAILVGAPVWLLRPRWREGLRERMGTGAIRVGHALGGRQQVWVHAVSVGEVMAVSRLVEELDARLGRGSVVISTTTQTGQQLARERFGAGRCFYFPVDLPWVVRGALRELRPRVLVLAESELWPNVLAECARERVPVVVVNGRVSDRSLPRYQKLRRLWRPFKFDAAPPRTAAIVERLRAQLPPGARLLVAGSTLEDEERVLLGAWPAICEQAPGAVMVLAPRHPERFARVAALAREQQARLIERSTWDGAPVDRGSVFLLDSIGELGSVYSLAAVAFVGGSLVAAGGHNPLEPARLGVPVLMGPHYENFREAVELLRRVEALRVVERANVGEAIARLMRDEAGAAAIGARGRKAFAQQARATQRAVDAVVRLLTEGNA